MNKKQQQQPRRGVSPNAVVSPELYRSCAFYEKEFVNCRHRISNQHQFVSDVFPDDFLYLVDPMFEQFTVDNIVEIFKRRRIIDNNDIIANRIFTLFSDNDNVRRMYELK